jgi:acetylornithine/N-succinyldiaminopimelate aminotransferase
MSVGNAVLDIILKKGFLENVQEVGNYFEKKLKEVQKQYSTVIEQVRGIGLLRGIQLKVDNGKFLDHLFQNKMLAVKAGDNVVRLLPPLIVETKDIDEAIRIITKTCSEF